MLPKQRDLEVPLLSVLKELGGRAKPADIYPRLQKFFPDITESDLTVTLPSGANKWKNCIAWVRQKLILQGEMASLARGVWAITDKGRQRLDTPGKYKAAGRTRPEKVHGSIQPNIENLLPATSLRVTQEARARRRPSGEPSSDFENEVWRLVLGLNPSAITIGKDPAVKLPETTFRPDLVALFEEKRVLLCECKLTSSDAFIAKWLLEFRSVKRDFEESFRKTGYSQFVYVLFVEKRAEIGEHPKKEADNLRVKILDARDLRYFETLQKKSGVGIGHIFWSRVAPWLIRNQDLRIPALRIRAGSRREAFIFSLNAHDLLGRCFVSHRELHAPEEDQIGFQRMLQKKKLNEIVKFINKHDVFPTPIVVAFLRKRLPVFEPLPIEQKAAQSMRHVIEFGHLRLPREPNSIQIVDGQHRLYGYSKLPRSEKHIVHVLGYRDEGKSLATMFVDINSKQTKVPGNLLWELYPDIYGEDDPEVWRAQISKTVESVAKEHMEGWVQHISTGVRGPISFQTLCSEVRRAGILEEVGGHCDRLQLVLEALFSALKLLGNRYERVNENFLFTNNGISPIIRIAGRIIKFEAAQNRRENLGRKNALTETFCRYFESVYRNYAAAGESRLRDMRKRTGNSGINQTEDEMTEFIRSEYLHGFPHRPRKTPPKWLEAVEKCVTLILTVNREASDRGRTQGWVFRDFDPDRFRKALNKPIDSEDAFETVVGQLYMDIFESGGKDGPDSRIKSVIGCSSVYELDAIDRLNVLRTYWNHNRTPSRCLETRESNASTRGAHQQGRNSKFKGTGQVRLAAGWIKPAD